MQWVFLVLAIAAALVELHSGTFYLAAVAAAALTTAALGYWIHNDLLILVFVLLCALLLAAVMLWHRAKTRRKTLADFDVGQSVAVRGMSPHGNRLMVSYRGVNWEAVTDDGSAPSPGDTAIITRKTDKLLHLVMPAKQVQT
jgi:membrane protein implicated in regulation of membrane protease activity